MSALLRKVVDKTEAMDSALKWSLLERVNDCVKELQLKCTSERSNSLINDEATNSFLWALEAVFIHGLTNSFLKATSPFASILNSFSSPSTVLNGSHSRSDSSPAVPNPSFWEFVLVFLHRDIIDQIHSLHLVHTDVGRCRAWLRIALNDGLLQSFLDNMTLKSNRRCLKAFYRSSAFLRDSEKCDILKNYLMGIELLDFRLVINNSFLNQWNSGPLSLVGLWVDENETVQQGVDVANNIESKEFQAIPKLHQRQQNSVISGTPPRFYSELDNVLRRQPTPLLSEDDALRIILSSSPARPSPITPEQTSSSIASKQQPLSGRRSPVITKSTKKSSSSINSAPQISSPQLVAVEAPKEIILDEVTSTNSPVVVINEPIQQELHPEETVDAPKFVTEPLVSVGGTLLQVSSPPEPTQLCSSPAVNLQRKMHFSASSIEESPVKEQSYTDLLLKFQERSNLPCIQGDDDFSMNNTVSTSANESVVSSQDGSGVSSHKTKNSTMGSVHTTSSSASVFNQTRFSKFSRAAKSLHSVEEGVDLISSPRGSKDVIMELLPRISKYTKVIANENGLDTQNYACKLCSTSIGMIYGPSYLCHFTGALYCSTCHTNQEKAIPSRILLNWDFGLYPVCKQAFDYIEDLKNDAIFDVQEINPLLYKEIDEFRTVKRLRTQLFYIAMYLKTCKNSKALEELKKEAGILEKDHLLDSVHIYSLTDIFGIPNRTLATLLTKLVSAGSNHILSCTICREKGFICECCRSPQVIFPFELEKIFKCSDCGAVYHKTCMTHEKPCPRCERWKKNQQAFSLDENDNV